MCCAIGVFVIANLSIFTCLNYKSPQLYQSILFGLSKHNLKQHEDMSKMSHDP